MGYDLGMMKGKDHWWSLIMKLHLEEITTLDLGHVIDDELVV